MEFGKHFYVRMKYPINKKFDTSHEIKDRVSQIFFWWHFFRVLFLVSWEMTIKKSGESNKAYSERKTRKNFEGKTQPQ